MQRARKSGQCRFRLSMNVPLPPPHRPPERAGRNAHPSGLIIKMRCALSDGRRWINGRLWQRKGQSQMKEEKKRQDEKSGRTAIPMHASRRRRSSLASITSAHLRMTAAATADHIGRRCFFSTAISNGILYFLSTVVPPETKFLWKTCSGFEKFT